MNKQNNSPKFHTVVTINVRTEFITRNLKVIFTTDGIFYPLLDYFIDNQFKSISWQNNATYIVGLFIDYIFVNKNFDLNNDRNKKIYFMPNFIKLLQNGSITNEGEDSLELFWFPKKISRVNSLINVLYSFLDWYYKKSRNRDSIFVKDYNDLSMNEKILYLRHWNNKRQTSLLSHIKTLDKNPSPIYDINKKVSFFKSEIYDIKYFDNSKIMDLLFTGFKRGSSSYDIRNIMITILMHFGGTRLSEPFHLFVNDIIEDPNNPGCALVKLYHPEDGYINYFDKYTNKTVELTRKEYLQKKYNLTPRNLQTGTNHAGWKDLALDKTGKFNYAIVYWFPTWAGKLFWDLYKRYIMEIGPKNLSNPYLFVSTHHKSFGLPYTINAFRDSHQNAIKKIKLHYKKEFGTTPHAHRHAYGQNLQNSGLPKNIIQKALHHKSPFSQMVYTLPSVEKINQVLNEASNNINEQIFIKNNNEDIFEDLKERFLR